MQYIYKISIPEYTSNVYIGKTSDPNKREYEHFYSARIGSAYAIHNAIRKYGEKNCIFEIIATCIENTNECANYCEKLIISQYDSYKNGYNMTHGGDGVIGYLFTPEQRERARITHLGKIPWNKDKKCPQLSGENHYLFGITGKNHPLSQTWKLYFSDGKILIIDNLKQWAKENNYNSARISDVFYNKQKYHKDIIKVEKC